MGEGVEPGDALVVATSGSTARPKGVVLTHDALTAHARAVHARLAVDRAADRWTACLPLAHVGGLGVVVRAVKDDVPLQVLPSYDDEAVDGTLVSLVPTILDRVPPSRCDGSAGSCWAARETRSPPGERRPHLRDDRVRRRRGLRRRPARGRRGEVRGRRAAPPFGIAAAHAYRDGHDPNDAEAGTPPATSARSTRTAG